MKLHPWEKRWRLCDEFLKCRQRITFFTLYLSSNLIGRISMIAIYRILVVVENNDVSWETQSVEEAELASLFWKSFEILSIMDSFKKPLTWQCCLQQCQFEVNCRGTVTLSRGTFLERRKRSARTRGVSEYSWLLKSFWTASEMNWSWDEVTLTIDCWQSPLWVSHNLTAHLYQRVQVVFIFLISIARDVLWDWEDRRKTLSSSVKLTLTFF